MSRRMRSYKGILATGRLSFLCISSCSGIADIPLQTSLAKISLSFICSFFICIITNLQGAGVTEINKRGLDVQKWLFRLFATYTTFHTRLAEKRQAERPDACCKECLNKELQDFFCLKDSEHFQKEMKLAVDLEGWVELIQVMTGKCRNTRRQLRTSSAWGKWNIWWDSKRS